MKKKTGRASRNAQPKPSGRGVNTREEQAPRGRGTSTAGPSRRDAPKLQRPKTEANAASRVRRIPTERLVVGRHAVQAFLQEKGEHCLRLYVQVGTTDASEIIELARRQGLDVQQHERDRLSALMGADLVHQGFILETRGFPYVDLEDVLEADLVLVLDGVEDPRNLGAAARAAFTLGAGALIVPARRAASVTATAHKSAAGALALLNVVQVENLGRALERLKAAGFWLVGAEADGSHQPWEIDCTGKTALVIGGEDRGLRRLTRENCDFVTSIPMAAADFSLNAADAATVLLYEVLRQRKSRAHRE